MAKATVKTEKEVVKVEKEVKTYQLTLSQEEAETLSVICAFVGGTEKSPKKHIDKIDEALGTCGIEYTSTKAYKLINNGGGIDFEDYE